MPSVISASTASNTALNFSADTSGVLEIRTGSSPTTALTIDASQNATFANVINGNGSGITSINAANVSSGVLAQARGGTGTTTGYYGFKNRIINGAMVIDQRNAGASISSISNGGTYTLDRWQAYSSPINKFTVQQNAGSVTPPAGFNNYLGVTSSSAYSSTTNDYFGIDQIIEGYNMADFNYGSANAKTVTLSFWVRSSLTGTFSGALRNGGINDRSYVFTYTISSANTWEQKSITITGPTTGTWLTTNGQGLWVWFDLGTGTSQQTSTVNAWQNANNLRATGSVSIVGTNGATFYITGCQLEIGSTATSFDYRPYGTELALCQRYAFTTDGSCSQGGVANATTETQQRFVFPVPMRASPTVSITTAGSWVITNDHAADFTASTVTILQIGASTQGARCRLGGFTGLTTTTFYGGVFVSGTAKLTFSSEL